MITLNINVMKIDKSLLHEGKTGGKYMGLVLFDNKEGKDQYGNDGYVVQDVGKERRLAGERGPIIGNWRNLEKRTEAAAPKPEAKPTSEMTDEDIPF
jgi:hypothetical protein